MPTTAPRLRLDAAAVLCGGRSRRMGRDKALLRLGDQTLLERTVGVLSRLAPRVYLACGAEERYAELGLECVLDRLPDGGPLAGLEAALTRLQADGGGWLGILACDMPRAESEGACSSLPGIERLQARERADLVVC